MKLVLFISYVDNGLYLHLHFPSLSHPLTFNEKDMKREREGPWVTNVFLWALESVFLSLSKKSISPGSQMCFWYCQFSALMNILAQQEMCVLSVLFPSLFILKQS